MTLNWHDVEKLKSEGRYAHAGALAAALGHNNSYGCHYGFRSTRYEAIAEFEAGWTEADYWLRKAATPENVE